MKSKTFVAQQMCEVVKTVMERTDTGACLQALLCVLAFILSCLCLKPIETPYHFPSDFLETSNKALIYINELLIFSPTGQ